MKQLCKTCHREFENKWGGDICYDCNNDAFEGNEGIEMEELENEVESPDTPVSV